MSAAKKNTGCPGFKIDPDTGKYVPVPVDWGALFSDCQTKRQNQEWSNPRKCNDTHSVQPIKFRKTETGVRKELFKPPSKNNEKTKDLPNKEIKSKAPGVRKSLIKCLPSKEDLRRPVIKKSESSESLRMVPITEELEQIEEPVKSQAYPFKSPMTPHLKFSAHSREDEVKTPDSLESNANFLRLEQECQSPMNVNTNESPVSSVCNMFENNMLINSEKKTASHSQTVNQKEIILEIKRTFGTCQELYQVTSSKIKEIFELQARQEEHFRKIVSLVDTLDDSEGNSSKSDNDEEKENSAIKRRSLRLQNKSPAQNKGRPVGSPGILKSGDLRKSTLTKSLVSKCQKYQINSPRIQKAIDMYNSTRSVCSALLTPKISRGEFVTSPKSLNWRNNLSLKVQEQCLLLQDTPVHK